MADPAVQERLEQFQYFDTNVDLNRVRRSSHGEFVFNLHLVIIHNAREVDVREEWLRANCEMFSKIAARKRHSLSRVGVAADHMHLTLGANITETPEDVALAYLKNLAYIHEMKRVFQDGYYMGTFGKYDLQAVRRNLSDRSSFHSREAGGAAAVADDTA